MMVAGSGDDKQQNFGYVLKVGLPDDYGMCEREKMREDQE